MNRLAARLAALGGLVAAAGCSGDERLPARPGAAGRTAVAFYGDSLTEAPGYAPFAGDGFVAVVRGVSGELGTEGSARFLADLEALVSRERVAAAVLLWGTNDVFALDYDEARLVESVLRAASRAADRGLRVVVALPPGFYDEGGVHAALNGRLASYAAALAARAAATLPPDRVRVVDLAPAFAAHPAPRSLYTDGVHWTAAGQALAGRTIGAELAALGVGGGEAP